ncbi:MAG TPA: D-aminoacyl-tRNA deacylase [Trueperaceae bacterium]
MRALVQRVSRARVTSGEELLGEIGAGLLVLLGVSHGDDAVTAELLAAKTAKLRIFPDDEGKMNRSVSDAGGDVLVVSQFTLYADVRGGNRPSFMAAARPERAQPLCSEYCRALSRTGLRVESGEFGADMAVELVNDGPVTIWLDSSELQARQG